MALPSRDEDTAADVVIIAGISIAVACTRSDADECYVMSPMTNVGARFTYTFRKCVLKRWVARFADED